MKIGFRSTDWLRTGLAVSLALALSLSVILLGTAGASGPVSGPLVPLRDPHGHTIRNIHNQLESSNWSGYVTAGYETVVKSYTSATATWVVPAVTNAPGMRTSYSSAWVGIGGFFTSSSESNVYSDLIQLGTEQDASSNGTTQYYAWYEMLPSSETVISSSRFAIHPKDKITATLADTGTVSVGSGRNKTQTQLWSLSMNDVTTGKSWSTSVDYNSSLSSAEWIMEAPYSNGILPLADYGTATFDPGTADGANPVLTESKTLDEAVVMYDPHGQTSNVSVPNTAKDGFNAAWGTGSTLTPVSPPSI